MTNRPKNALEWFKLYSQGGIYVKRLEDDDTYNKPKYKYIIQQACPKTNEVVKEYYLIKDLPISRPTFHSCKNTEKIIKGYKWQQVLQPQ